MHEVQSRPSEDTRVGLMAIAATLMAIGVVLVFSTYAARGPASPDPPSAGRIGAFAKQVTFAVCGFAAMVGLAAVHYRFWRRPWVVLSLMTLSLGLLMLVMAPGFSQSRQGARRWLSVAGMVSFQPSELAKLAAVVFLSWWATRGRRGAATLRRLATGFLPAAAVLGLVIGLIGLEDFGTAALLSLVVGCMLLVGGSRIWHLLLAALPAAAALGYLLVSRPYRLERLRAFGDIWSDPRGSGYHVIQSLCAIASGGWWGKGLGLGVQKYGYLPAAHNDFIFAIICEELGGVGGLAVIGLFAALLVLGARTMRRAADDFGRMLAFGLTLLIALQAAMNIAVVTGLAPAKGIGLPLVSAGGSGVLFMAAAVGLLASIARRAGAFPASDSPPA